MLPLVSIVVPAFNEAEGLPRLLAVLGNVLGALEGRYRFEILIVDDGSRDGTSEVVRAACSRDRRLRYLKLARNFGHQAALTAGFEHARGACVVTLDADLQHPPTLVPAMLEAWEGGADVVDTRRRTSAGVGLFKGLTSRLFYRLLPLLTGLPVGEGASDFRLLDRQVVEVLVRLPERRRFYRGLVPWLGFDKVTLEFDAGERSSGDTKYSLSKMLRLAADGVFGFTELPLRVALFAGVVGMVFGGLYGVWVLYQTMVNHATLPGWTSLLVTVILFGSLNLFVLGILGEYLGRIHEQAKGRPIYVVDRRESVGAGLESDDGRDAMCEVSRRARAPRGALADGER